VKIDSNARKALLLAALVAIAGVLGVRRWQSEATPLTNEAARMPAALEDGVPGPDEASLPPALAEHPPDSPWLDKRMRRYAGLFRGTHCHTLVVPMQVEGGAFDRPSRAIMTADLALALRTDASCVADPDLVDIALGEMLRRRPMQAVHSLAREMRADEVILAYAGHYRDGSIRVTLQRRRADDTTIAAHSFVFGSYDDTHPAFLAFRSQLPSMLAAVGLKAGPQQVPRAAGPLPDATPRSFEPYLNADGSSAPQPAVDAANLMFLGMLTPAVEWPAGDRLFTKAWIALEPVADNDPLARRLRARILMHIYERPYALSLIANDMSPEADGLRAVLNGNLPQARAALASSLNPWDRFFLSVEISDLEYAYGRDARPTRDRLMQQLRASPLFHLIQFRLRDNDAWERNSTGPIKILLDRAFPIQDGGMLARLTGAAAPDYGPDAELAPLRRLHQLIQIQPRLWCCASFSPRPDAADLLDLLDSRTEYTLGRQAYFYAGTQALYDKGLETLESYDDELAGSPCTEETRADIYWWQMASGDLAQHDQRNRKMHAAARLVVWWNQGQALDTNNVMWVLHQPPQDPILHAVAHYTDDYPMRPYWSVNLHRPTAPQRLAFSQFDVDPLIDLLDHSSGAAHATYVRELDTRFIGSYAATKRRLQEMPADVKTVARLQAEIKADPDNWWLYDALAKLHLADHDYAGARQSVLSYPPFHEDDPSNPVELSNYAAKWGRTLMYAGALDDSRALLQASAAYDSGSDDNIWAKTFLALLDGDFQQAAEAMQYSSQRYDDQSAMRELDSLLFASGGDEDGWKYLQSVTEQFRAPTVLTAALVGHRRDDASPAQVDRWYSDRLASTADPGDRNSLLVHDFMEQFIDRNLPTDLPAWMGRQAKSSDMSVRRNGDVYRLRSSGETPERVGPSEFGRSRHAKLVPGSAVPDELSLIADALLSMQAGHYEEAVTKFDRLSGYYQIARSNVALPYFAVAAAKTGDKLGLGAYLDALPPDRQDFEVNLARGVFAALSGKSEVADESLQRAQDSWINEWPDEFPHSAYQYMNVCTMLYEVTGRAAYREDALRLAELLRRIKPAVAYAPALVAYLGRNEKEQGMALAQALYLDPQSRWARKAPATIQARARAILQSGGNPLMPPIKWPAGEN
jgi:hypothetical protein